MTAFSPHCPTLPIFLVGCGDSAPNYANKERVTVIQNYVLNELPDLLSRLQPDLALLLSHVPETFSYTLQELRELAIPMLGVRIGSFVDRIEDNVTGFLCEAEPEVLITRIKHLGDNRLMLVRIHNNLKSLRHRSVRDMIADYDRLSHRLLIRNTNISSSLTSLPHPEEICSFIGERGIGPLRRATVRRLLLTGMVSR